MKRYIFVVMILTILSKAFGFARDIILSYYYGAGGISDAFLISTTIPLAIFAMVGVGVTTGFIPIYTKITSEESKSKADDFTNNLLNIMIFLTFLIMSVSLLFTEQIVRVFAIGFDDLTFRLAVNFTRISLVGIIFSGIISILTSYLQANNKFYFIALIGLPLNFFTILAIFLSYQFNVLILPIGATVALISQAVFLVLFAFRSGYKYRFKFSYIDANIINMMKVSVPAIIGVSASQINLLIDRTLASSITVGGISALNYSHRLIDFVIGIFIAPIITVIYPRLAQSSVEKNLLAFKRTLGESVVAMSLFVLPCMVGFFFFSAQIIRFLFGRGNFDEYSVLLTSGALIFYSIGIIGLGLREIVSRSFYALGEAKIPVTNAIISVVINIVLNIVLSKYMGIDGLALATSLSAIIATFLMFGSLRKHIGPFGMKQISISFIKITTASLLMGILSRLSFEYLESSGLSQNKSLLIAITIGAVLYFIFVSLMKIKDIDEVLGEIKKKFSR